MHFFVTLRRATLSAADRLPDRADPDARARCSCCGWASGCCPSWWWWRWCPSSRSSSPRWPPSPPIDPDLLKLMRTFDASRWRTFRHVELPAALPGVFTGAKIAVIVAVIGAVFAEQSGANAGLGYLFRAVDPPAADRPRLRRRGDPVPVRDRPVRPAHPGRAAHPAVGPASKRRLESDETTRSLFLLTAAAAALRSGGVRREEGQRSQPASACPALSVMLDWFPNADHVGLYRALAEGDFKSAGLDVHVQVPSDPATPLQLLAAGKVDLADLLRARAAAGPRQGSARWSRSPRSCSGR